MNTVKDDAIFDRYLGEEDDGVSFFLLSFFSFLLCLSSSGERGSAELRRATSSFAERRALSAQQRKARLLLAFFSSPSSPHPLALSSSHSTLSDVAKPSPPPRHRFGTAQPPPARDHPSFGPLGHGGGSARSDEPAGCDDAAGEGEGRVAVDEEV